MAAKGIEGTGPPAFVVSEQSKTPRQSQCQSRRSNNEAADPTTCPALVFVCEMEKEHRAQFYKQRDAGCALVHVGWLAWCVLLERLAFWLERGGHNRKHVQLQHWRARAWMLIQLSCACLVLRRKPSAPGAG